MGRKAVATCDESRAYVANFADYFLHCRYLE